MKLHDVLYYRVLCLALSQCAKIRSQKTGLPNVYGALESASRKLIVAKMTRLPSRSEHDSPRIQPDLQTSESVRPF